ncbi:hypothetical protein B0H19DRAFT_1259817 [Mycena capillaripes]|nr:hypothetical protein B0H19DRAFT_1259817 [Mycena capillaripes]
MSEPAPYKRTRVFLACLNCRRRKIKCLTEDSEQNPCERCVRKGLVCEYRPVADDQEHNAGTTHSYERQAAPSAAPASSPYPLGNQRPPQSGNAQYPPSMVYGSTPGSAPYSYGGQQLHPGSSQSYGQPQGYNAPTSGPASPYGSSAPTPQQRSPPGYPANYSANWPAAFTPLSSQPHAFTLGLAVVDARDKAYVTAEFKCC